MNKSLFDKQGNLKILEKSRRRKQEEKDLSEKLYKDGKAIKIFVIQVSQATPMRCHIKIQSKNPKNLEEVEKLFNKSKSLFRSYNRNIEMNKKGNTLIIEIPGYKYRCSYCQNFRDYLKENLKVIEEQNCAEFEKHVGKNYSSTSTYRKIIELKKRYLQ